MDPLQPGPVSHWPLDSLGMSKSLPLLWLSHQENASCCRHASCMPLASCSHHCQHPCSPFHLWQLCAISAPNPEPLSGYLTAKQGFSRLQPYAIVQKCNLPSTELLVSVPKW